MHGICMYIQSCYYSCMCSDVLSNNLFSAEDEQNNQLALQQRNKHKIRLLTMSKKGKTSKPRVHCRNFLHTFNEGFVFLSCTFDSFLLHTSYEHLKSLSFYPALQIFYFLQFSDECFIFLSCTIDSFSSTELMNASSFYSALQIVYLNIVIPSLCFCLSFVFHNVWMHTLLALLLGYGFTSPNAHILILLHNYCFHRFVPRLRNRSIETQILFTRF